MRLQNKYKNFNKLSFIFDQFPTKISHFHRTKWKKIKELLLKQKEKKKKKQKKSSIWFSTILLRTKRWFFYRSKYSRGLNLKRSFDCLFDKAFSVLFLKKLKYLNKKLDKILEYSIYNIKPEYRIDIFLWRLNFFFSCYHSRAFINNKKIKINNETISHPNYFLKKGDIVFFESLSYYSDFVFKNILLKKTNTFKLFSFIEIDYYTNTVIVLKNYDELTKKDLMFFVNECYTISKLKTFIE